MKRRWVIGAAAGGSTLAALGLYWTQRWNHIVIHHTAGNYATMDLLRQVHRERQAQDPIDMVPYHYVIGNGNGLGLGEVVSTRRAELNLWGAHVSNRTRNILALGVCLVGNFETSRVPETQFQAAVTLTKALMKRNGIGVENVTPHGRTPGESTKCPGKQFPYEEFLRAIS